MVRMQYLLVLLACAAVTESKPLVQSVNRFRLLRGKYVAVNIGDSNCSVTDYGAVGDGKTDDTKAIQKALDGCNNGQGGMVIVPKGVFLITSVEISRSNTELHIAQDATLLVSNDMKNYPSGKHIIEANGVSHIAITGTGKLDGQGLVWWQECRKSGKENIWRPHTVNMENVNVGYLADTLYVNGPNHILELYCNTCEVSGVKVLNPPSTGDCEKSNECSHNTDAVDVHGDPFWVHDVNFTTGDDNIAGHANNTLVEDSYFGSGHGASIGSLCNDWLTNITFRNIKFHGTTAGARIKSHSKCGGHVWNVVYENLEMSNVQHVITLTQFYDVSESMNEGSSTSMMFTNISFNNITADKCGEDTSGKNAVAFDCATTTLDRKTDNCVVSINDLHLTGLEKTSEMECQGVSGDAKDLEGISNCLDH